jgi:small-conductance mechanosensitive channel
MKDDPEWSPIAVAMVLLGVGYVSWFAIRDYVNGVFLRAGRVIRQGDRVSAAGHHGIVQRLGVRTLTLVTNDDREVVLPYSAVSREPITRRAIGPRVHRHEIHLPRSFGLPENAIEKLRQAAAFMHWSAVSHPVKVELRADTIIIVVHLVSAQYAANAESHLRHVLQQLENTGPSASIEEHLPASS